jgi:hypothetical protein
MNLNEYKVLFILVTVVVALFVASPVLSKVLVYPRTEFFSEMWLLGSNHTAEGYPYNITKNADYAVFLGIGNQLGHCAHYVVEVKFRNETQSAPSSFGPIENRTPSSMSSLLNISAFVADEQNWELPVSFSFDYEVSLDKSSVAFHGLTLNSQVLSLEGYVTARNATRSIFYGNLVFELWIYDANATALSYHGRFVDLKLNMTAY